MKTFKQYLTEITVDKSKLVWGNNSPDYDNYEFDIEIPNGGGERYTCYTIINDTSIRITYSKMSADLFKKFGFRTTYQLMFQFFKEYDGEDEIYSFEINKEMSRYVLNIIMTILFTCEAFLQIIQMSEVGVAFSGFDENRDNLFEKLYDLKNKEQILNQFNLVLEKVKLRDYNYFILTQL